MQFQSFTIGAEETNERLDICLTKKTGLSRNFVQNLIKDGLVRVNKIQIEKPDLRSQEMMKSLIRFLKKTAQSKRKI